MINEKIKTGANRIHGVLVDSVAMALMDIFQTGRHADKVIEYYLKSQKKWGARDRRFFAESVYEIVRWWRWLWWLSGQDVQLEQNALRKIWAIWWLLKKGDLPADYTDLVDGSALKKKQTEFIPAAIRESVPDWLFDRGLKELGDQWEPALRSLNQPAKVYLRVNQWKGDSALVCRLLAEEGIEASPVAEDFPETLVLKERKNVFITKAFHGGHFEVQDWSSQHVAPLLDVAPGMRVLDACAGAGGKSLHLASLMKNKGKLIAMDIHEWKLKELRKRATRNSLDIIEVKLFEGQKTIKRMTDSFDRVLLDVPCSGLGVLRRNPDTKWKLKEEELLRLQQTQKEILESYSKLLKPGGKLVYSTCSLLPSENDQQVQDFLKSHPGFKLLSEQTFMPQQRDWDGFYAALLERTL